MHVADVAVREAQRHGRAQARHRVPKPIRAASRSRSRAGSRLPWRFDRLSEASGLEDDPSWTREDEAITKLRSMQQVSAAINHLCSVRKDLAPERLKRMNLALAGIPRDEQRQAADSWLDGKLQEQEGGGWGGRGCSGGVLVLVGRPGVPGWPIPRGPTLSAPRCRGVSM